MTNLAKFMIAIIIFTTTGSVFAKESRGEPGKQKPRHSRGMQDTPIVEHLMRAVHRLDLSEEQRDGIKSVMHGMKQDIRPVMLETKAGHEQLKALISADEYDEEAVAVVAEQEGQLAVERVLIASRAASEILGHLTAEQREELSTMGDKRRKHVEMRKQRHLEQRDQQLEDQNLDDTEN